MPDETTPPTPQAGNGGTNPQPQAGNSSTDPQAGSRTPEDYERIIADLRKENASHRTKLKKHEDDEAARQTAALSDAEKLQKRAEQAEQQIKQYKDQLVLEKVMNAAHQKNIVDPELAALAIKDKLELGDDGLPTNVEKALDDLVKNKPYFVKPADQTPASPAQTANPTLPAMNPGRSSITQPGGNVPGKIPRLEDIQWKR